jgi:ribonucleotide monophosphatase NagD (HAD superfamily)
MMFSALFIDLSGVLYTGKQAIPGAVTAIAKARASQLTLRFITNTSRRTRAQILIDLKNTNNNRDVTAKQRPINKPNSDCNFCPIVSLI